MTIYSPKIPRQGIPPHYPSVKGVATINDDIAASHEGGGIGSEEDGETVEVLDGTKAVLRSKGAPDLLLGVEGWDVVQGGIHVTW